MTAEYIAYVRTFLHRRGPNNGIRPKSYGAWQEWIAEEDEIEGRDYLRSVAIDNAQWRFV